jgi:CFEM domain
MTGAISGTGCSQTDLKCLCSDSGYIDSVTTCIQSSCDASDAQNAFAYAQFACNSAGVQVPSPAEVLSSLSAESASAAASTTSSAVPAPAPATSTTAQASTTAAAAGTSSSGGSSSSAGTSSHSGSASSSASPSASASSTLKTVTSSSSTASASAGSTAGTVHSSATKVGVYENGFLAALALGVVIIAGGML